METTDMIIDLTIKNRIKADEGFRLYVYPDSRGNLTAGWGHALLKNSLITEEIACLLFEMDWKRTLGRYGFFITRYQLTLNPVRRGVIINMLFQMGYKGVCGFKNMIICLRAEDYEGVAKEMLDSQWARRHEIRSSRLANQMRTGRR